MGRKKYYTEEDRLKARRKVPDQGASFKVTTVDLKKERIDDVNNSLHIFIKEYKEKKTTCIVLAGLGFLLLVIGAGIVLLIYAAYLYIRNEQTKPSLNYQTQPFIETDFLAFINSICNLTKATMASVVNYGTYNRRRTHGNAVSSLDTYKLRIQKGYPEFINLDRQVPSIILKENITFFFLPDFIIFTKRGDFMIIPYSKVTISYKKGRWITTDIMKDATFVGTTWAKVNQNGTPDRRFKNNYKMNIYEVGYLEIQSVEGEFYIKVQCSNSSLAVNCFNTYQTYISRLNNTTIDYTTSKEDHIVNIHIG